MNEEVIIGGKDYTDTDPTARLIDTKLGTEAIQRSVINVVLKALAEIRDEYAADPLSWREAHSPDRNVTQLDTRLLKFIG